MTFKEFKEVLESRVKLLGTYSGSGDAFREVAARHDEAQTILELVDRVDTKPPLYRIDSETGVVEQMDELEPEWGKQLRGDWPKSTFGQSDEDDPRGYDPRRHDVLS